MAQQSGQPRHAEVAGAGIGGLAVAAALAQRGWSVTLHERSDSLRTFGAGIYTWSNGLHVLRALGAFENAVKGAHYGPAFETRNHLNETMERIPINGPEDAELVTALRENLLQSMVKVCRDFGVDIRVNSAAVGARADGTLLLASGEERQADLVVGADGINSAVRDSRDLLMYRKNLGYGAARMMLGAEAIDAVDRADREKYIEHFSGTLRILYTPVDAENLYIALCSPDDDEKAKALPVDRTLWISHFPHLKDLIEQFGSEGRWDAFEIVKLRQWSDGKVAIVGDAAHAMPPYLGQGGGCALMNALSLAEAVNNPKGDLPAALRKWEVRERPLTEHTQDTAERLGDMNYWPDDVRSDVLKITGTCEPIARDRMRTARHIPTGCQK